MAPPPKRLRRITGVLLDELENGLLRLVGLLKSGHAGRLQNVVLSHVGNRLADVGIDNAVLGALQILHSVGCVARSRVEAVDRCADGAAGGCDGVDRIHNLAESKLGVGGLVGGGAIQALQNTRPPTPSLHSKWRSYPDVRRNHGVGRSGGIAVADEHADRIGRCGLAEDLRSVEVRGGVDLGDLLLDGLVFGVKGGGLGAGEAAGRSFGGQGHGAVQEVGNLR